MAELREVIIGNIRLTILAGPKPDDRDIMIRGEATIYDQQINATRTHTDDMTANMTVADLDTYTTLVNRFIAALMQRYDIDQNDLNEGQGILDNAEMNQQPLATGAPLVAGTYMPPPPPPIPPQTSAPMPEPNSYGTGALVQPALVAPTEPTSTESGEGTIIVPPVEGA